MATPLFSVTLKGGRDVIGRYAKFDLSHVAQQELLAIRAAFTYALKQEAPVRTGRLMKGIRVVGSPPQMRYIATAYYASYVLRGTKPHIIRAKRPGGYLRFTTGGQVVYRRMVHHPGTRPNPFNERALKSIMPRVESALRRLGMKISTSLGG